MLKIATRKSNLAQIQADIVRNSLKEKLNIDSEKLLIKTEGDKRLDISLNKIGGKGLFIKDLEEALLDKRADIAVHSMKDMPYEIHEKFLISAILKREDPRDVLITKEKLLLKDLKKGARIGTGSIRRGRLLKEIRDDLNIVPIRGNLETRIGKIETENLDGIILAAAGIKRIKKEEIISEYLDPLKFIPAVAQGAIGIETLKNNKINKELKLLEDRNSRIEVFAERSFMKSLKGDCNSLVGAYSKVEGDRIYIIGTFEVNNKIVKKDIEGDIEDSINLGEKLAKLIIL